MNRRKNLTQLIIVALIVHTLLEIGSAQQLHNFRYQGRYPFQIGNSRSAFLHELVKAHTKTNALTRTLKLKNKK